MMRPVEQFSLKFLIDANIILLEYIALNGDISEELKEKARRALRYENVMQLRKEL